MQKRNIILDLDDTINRLQTGMLQYVNSKSNQQYRYREIFTYDLEGINPALDTIVQEFLTRPDLVIKTKPFPKAHQAVQMLYQAGYQIHLVSSRLEPLHQATKDWLKIHQFDQFISEVHPRPSTIKGRLFKTQIARKINALATFDDAPTVTEELAKAGFMVYLIRRPWNRQISGNHLIRPYRSFYQATLAFLKENNDTN